MRWFPLLSFWVGLGLLPLLLGSCAAGEPSQATPAPTATRTRAPRATPTPTPTAVQAQPPSSANPPDEADFALTFEAIATGLTKPVYVTPAGDGSGRLFIVEQPGRIRIWNQGALLSQPFLDITQRVNDGASERGLLGLAFAPDFARSLHFYVNYTDARGHTAVTRFAVSPTDGNRALPASEHAVLQVPQPASNHNGGMLLFGPDGMLWIGLGDGGAANDAFGNGQNLDSLLGKMLRLDVTTPAGGKAYGVPPDNPWRGREGRPEIWALGLRNPWRYSFDRATGDLWIADVGQNLYEEVHIAWADGSPGLNFGWPVLEGNHCFQRDACDTQGLELAVAEFPHLNGVCSITGGYVYRGRRTPALHGQYIVGDYCNGQIWRIENVGSRADPAWSVQDLADTEFRISSFGEDEDGELYLVDHVGAVYRMHFAVR